MSEPEPIKEVIDSKSESLKEIQNSDNDNKNNNESFNCEKCGSDGHNTEDHGKNGGKRKGAGFPKGLKKQKTLEAMKVKEAFTQRILQHADRLFNAQMNLAVGEQVLMVKIKERDSKGKVLRTYFEQVEDIETIKQYLDYQEGINDAENPDDDEHYYFLTTKAANNQALDSLVNRALGKVPEKLEVGGGFFNATKLVVEVIGSKHADIEFNEAGDVIYVESGDNDGSETPTEPKTETST